MSSKDPVVSTSEDGLVMGIGKLKVKEQKDYTFVDSVAVLSTVLDTLVDLPTTPPSMYVDLEGINLSRLGSISILQIFVLPKDHTYLIDIHLLQGQAFSTIGEKKRQSLKTILETEAIPKAIFDVRKDSDALYHLFGVKLAGIEDIQLMELATRLGRKRFLNGLSKCVEGDCVLSTIQRQQWKACKDNGVKLFAPERGGSYEMFNQRPLAKELIEYCIEDVKLLPQLWRLYDSRLTAAWRLNVKQETTQRIVVSQGKVYIGNGRHNALAPAGWA